MKYIVLLKQWVVLFIFFSFVSIGVFAQEVTEDDLILYGNDVRIEEQPQAGGFFIYIRNRPEIGSILLTESSERPNKDANTYAYTARKFNDVNGNEKRVLNGRFIQPRSGFFIIDSTPEPDLQFGSAFVLFLPYQVDFGYETTRNGSINLKENNLYMSIRAFEKPYANYEGAYKDNPFYLERIPEKVETDPPPTYAIEKPPILDPEIINSASSATPVVPENIEVPVTTVNPIVAELNTASRTSLLDRLNSQYESEDDKYDPETVVSFQEIAVRSNTKAIFVENKDDIIDQISNVLFTLPEGESADIVIMLDTTRSMWDDLAVIKSRLIPTISRILEGQVYRIGLILYRDVGENYITQKFNFSDQLEQIQNYINAVQANGGGDWPEAVYEALEVAVNEFPWAAKNRIAFIIGDAPAHDPPKSGLDVDELYLQAERQNILVFPLIVPKR